jgi:hypothetical protein
VKYVGLETNEALAGFELHFYSPDEYAQNVASVRQFQKDYAEYLEAKAKLQKDYEQAMNDFAPVEKAKKLLAELKSLRMRENQFVRKTPLYKVTHVADDYLLLIPDNRDRKPIIIPTSKIVRMHLSSLPQPDAPTSAEE